MVKVISPQQSTSNDGTKKQRQKQAKREAKTMLQLEQAKKDVQKAEQKVAKAQARLEDSRTHLRSLEEKLTKLRDSGRSPGQQASDQPAHTDEENHADTSTSTHAVISSPPTEGRSDIEGNGEFPASALAEETPPPATEHDEAPADDSEDATSEEHHEETSATQPAQRASRSRRRSQTRAGGSDTAKDQ